jgi:hypothetical protein
LAVDALPRSHACHCRDCQTWSGSAFTLKTFVPEAAPSVSRPLTVDGPITPGGNPSWQRMCPV